MFLVIGTVAANLVFLLLSPSTVVPPRLSEQLDKALLTLGFSLVPFAWGFYLLFAYRNSKERILAYVAIAVSLLWLGMSTYFLIQVIKERRIYRPDATAAGDGASPGGGRLSLGRRSKYLSPNGAQQNSPGQVRRRPGVTDPSSFSPSFHG